MSSRSVALALVAAALAALAFAMPASASGGQRLVIRGEDTVTEGPCAAGVCELGLADGRFRGTPVGNRGLRRHDPAAIADMFPNGEGGVCAPIRGHITLGAGSPDRLVLALTGDSCQDGEGEVTTSSFTGVARFTVVRGTGAYAGAPGAGWRPSRRTPPTASA